MRLATIHRREAWASLERSEVEWLEVLPTTGSCARPKSQNQHHTLVVKTQVFKTKTQTLSSTTKTHRSKNQEHNSITDWLKKIITHVIEWCAAMKMMIYWSRYNWSPFNDSTINTQQRSVNKALLTLILWPKKQYKTIHQDFEKQVLRRLETKTQVLRPQLWSAPHHSLPVSKLDDWRASCFDPSQREISWTSDIGQNLAVLVGFQCLLWGLATIFRYVPKYTASWQKNLLNNWYVRS